MNPYLWLAAQKAIGGTYGKQRLALSHYRGGAILEIGCSLGNIAEAFDGKALRYLGQDIDRPAIEAAKKRLPQFSFTSDDLSSIDEKFDYVMVAGVLHHVNDETAIGLLSHARRLAAPGATIISYDPLPVERSTTIARRIIGKLEAGQWIRTFEELASLYRAAGIEPHRQEVFALPAWRASKPEITDLAVIAASR